MKLARQRSATIVLDLPAPPEELSLTELWHWHRKGQTLYQQTNRPPQSTAAQPPKRAYNWLQIKRTLAWKLLASCDFCVHHCQINRLAGETAYCRLGAQARISGSYLHWGEESPIRPTWAIFFAGCTMHCLYCHNWRETFDFSASHDFDSSSLVNDLNQYHGQYRSISLIGGTPEPNLQHVLDLVLALPAEIDVPLVFNNNATLSQQGLELMEGVVDIYLPDFKHGNDRCAWNLTKISDYLAAVTANLTAYRKQGAAILVRHLVLPGHLNCCTRPVLDCLAQDFADLSVNVLFQYRPMYKAETLPGLEHRLSSSEQEQVSQWVKELGLKQVN